MDSYELLRVKPTPAWVQFGFRLPCFSFSTNYFFVYSGKWQWFQQPWGLSQWRVCGSYVPSAGPRWFWSRRSSWLWIGRRNRRFTYTLSTGTRSSPNDSMMVAMKVTMMTKVTNSLHAGHSFLMMKAWFPQPVAKLLLKHLLQWALLLHMSLQRIVLTPIQQHRDLMLSKGGDAVKTVESCWKWLFYPRDAKHPGLHMKTPMKTKGWQCYLKKSSFSNEVFLNTLWTKSCWLQQPWLRNAVENFEVGWMWCVFPNENYIGLTR